MNALNRYKAGKRYKAKLNLLSKIHRQIEPVLTAKREAESDSYTNRNHLENSEELYGRKPSLPDIYRLAIGGQSADVETEEREKVLIHATGHNHADESITKPVVCTGVLT